MLLKVTMKKRCNKYYLMDSVLKKNDKEEIQINSLKIRIFKRKTQNNDEYFYKTLEQSGMKKISISSSV